MKYLRWLILLVLAIVLVAFAIWNRHLVVVDLWPFPQVQVPLFLLVLGGLFVGFVIGGLVQWRTDRTVRRRARRAEKRSKALEQELEAQERRRKAAEAPTADAGSTAPGLTSRVPQSARLPGSAAPALPAGTRTG